MIGPCAKLEVKCTIVSKTGRHFVGTNYCKTAQTKCPRHQGEGYEKCKSICNQVGHAEQVAVMVAGKEAEGGHAYLENHTYACRECQEALFAAGVVALSVGIKPPKEIK